MPQLLVIDGTPLLYRGYFSPGTKHLRTSAGLISGGFYGALKIVQALQARFARADFSVCFGMGLSGRERIYAGYKPTSRIHEEAAKPEGFLRQLEDLQCFLRAVGMPVFMMLGVEADDLISLLACMWAAEHSNHAVIVSSDHDFLQLVNEKIMCYDDKAKRFTGPAEVEERFQIPADAYLRYKAYVGDVSDNIPSIPGYGPVRAREAVLGMRTITDPAHAKAYDRNLRLMTLPRTLDELTCLSVQQRFALRTQIRSTFKSFLAQEYASLQTCVDLETAQALLDKYECKSFRVEHFARYHTH